MAETLGVSFSGRPPSASTLAHLVGRADIVGIRYDVPATVTQSFGRTEGKPTAEATLDDGTVLTLWAEPLDPSSLNPMAELLRLYLIITGAFVLLIAFVLLTRLIVRPVEELTRASERLSRGVFTTKAEVAGGAEVASLAVSFNRMAKELEEDRSLLKARLEALKQKNEELSRMQDQLIRSEKLASVGRLAAGVAHEIGNPLAAILGLVELLMMGGLSSAEQTEFLGRIRGETERIHRIIRDLLDFSRQKPVGAELEQTSNLADAVEDAVKLVSPQKDLRGVTIERRFDEEVPRVRAPEHALSQLLLNLLLNAADAVSGDGTILIEVAHEGDEVVLRLSDTGPGIDEAVRDKLFEPFVTTKPAGKGTGLGLSVCLALAEQLGGSIEAKASALGGACFEVRLPAVPGPAAS
jgi:signal transduction histidine kinase